MNTALGKKYFNQIFVGQLIVAVIVVVIYQINISELFNNYRYLLITTGVMVFSVLFFVDFKNMFKEFMQSRNVVLLVSVIMAIVAALIFVGVIMLPVYLTEISNTVLWSVLCAMVGGVLGYQQVLFLDNQTMVGDGFFARIRFAIGGAIIGGTVGLGIHLFLSFFS